MTHFEIVGLVGVGIVFLAYLMLATKQWKSHELRYPIANIVGTCGILYSLLFDVNIPSIVAQLVWISISVFAIFRILKPREQV